MIHVIKTRTGRAVAILRSWDGVVIDTDSGSGHWTWCVGRLVPSVLSWARVHNMQWDATNDESVWTLYQREMNHERSQ